MNKIQSTEDYTLFKRIGGNRLINKSHVAKLKISIADDPRLALATPILVDDNHKILDGQHRLEALKQLKLPVHYYQVKGLKLPDVQTINSATRTWSPADYARSFSELGYKDYSIYLDFKKEYKLSHSILLVYLSGVGRHKEGNTTPAFKKGKFKVGDIKVANELCKKLVEVEPLYKKWKTRAFALAFQKAVISPTYDHKRMLDKLSKHGATMLKDTSHTEEYLRQLEKLYNYRMSNENRMRLF